MQLGVKRTMQSPAVVALTPWRLREARRKEAKLRDKAYIKELEGEVHWLKRVYWEWWSWYQSCVTETTAETTAAADAAAGAVETQKDGARLEVVQRPIDYSKWDGACTSEEEDDVDAMQSEEGRRRRW